MNVIRAAEEAFAAMPAEVRDRFQKDPGRFLEFANDASNYDEALKMGLAIRKKQQSLKVSERRNNMARETKAWEYEKEGMGLQYNYGQQAAAAYQLSKPAMSTTKAIL